MSADFENALTIISLPSTVQIEAQNYSYTITKALDPVSAELEQYDQFITDVWVGIVLTLVVVSCVICMCSCLLYHKFQQWKRSSKF